MQDRTPVLFALKKIVDDKVPFQVALEKTQDTYNLSSEDKKQLVHDVLGSLRRFFLLRAEILDVFPTFQPDDDETYLLILGLFELRMPKTDKTKTIAGLVDTAKLHGLRLKEKDLSAKLLALAQKPPMVPAAYRERPLQNNAILFNQPEWVVTSYVSEYGPEVAAKILIALNEPPLLYLTVNTLRKKGIDFAADKRFKVFPSLSKSYPFGASLLCERKGRASQFGEVVDGSLFAQDISYFRFLDALPLLQYGKALHINAGSGVTSAGLALRLKELHGVVTAAYSDERKYARGKSLHERLGLANSTHILAEPKMVKTLETFDSYDLVVVTPTSTHLGQTRRRPDVSVVFATDTLGLILAKEDEALLEASFFPAIGGTLAYTVPSVLKEEGEDRINAFLDQRKNYALVGQKTIFPFANGDSDMADGLYYAVLERKW